MILVQTDQFIKIVQGKKNLAIPNNLSNFNSSREKVLVKLLQDYKQEMPMLSTREWILPIF